MKKHYSKILSLSVLLIMAATVPQQHAQTVAAVRVMSNPDGPWFTVDGTVFYHAMSAFWPAGSLHTLNAPSGTGYAYNLDQTIQWQFQGWQWNGGTLNTNPIQVIADPNITEYKAQYSTLNKFTLHISCGSSPCDGIPGTVSVDGTATSSDISSWQSPGAGILLQAYPATGWTFAGWQPGPHQTIVGWQNTVSMVGPMTVNAVFTRAKPMTFVTNPPNLQIYVDRTVTTPPITFQWAQGSTHSVAGMDVQIDGQGKRWVFQSWSDGGASSHDYVTPNNNNPVTLTANHVAAAYPYFLTSPPMLNLVVDNLILPPPYSYIWGIGQTHHVEAPATQTDSQGTVWNFKSWDDLVTTRGRDITVPVGADQNGFRLTALFTAQAKMVISSSLSGLAVNVDGVACTTPCTIVRDPGAQVRVSAPLSISVRDGSRQDFIGWSNGGGALVSGDWVGTMGSSTTSISANYHLMNRLTAVANPSEGAAWNIVPASADGFYDSETTVNLGITARSGYRFSNWSGDLSGSSPSGVLSMSAPHQVMAQLSHVPYISAAGVSNAAGGTPQPGVAPGSVASIFGASLAATTAVGPGSPLVQTLAGVVTHIDSRLLPLYFASPAQINLQIPPDLPLGTQTITVSSDGMPDVKTTMTIVRNAPGLFPFVLDGQTYVLALHEDGSLITPTSPAQKGELLTFYGTGFGPTDHPRLDGIALPATPPYLFLDPVTVQVGPNVVAPEHSFAAPGQIGVDLTQFRLDSSAPSGSSVEVFLTVNGVKSNTLYLPIQ